MSILTQNENVHSDFLLKIIEHGIKQEAERIYEEKKKEMIEELERQKAQAVAGVVLAAMKTVDIRTMNNHIELRVSMADFPV